MYKRMLGVFCAMILLLTGMIFRIYYIDASDYIAAAAQVQGRYRLNVAGTRGVVYDRELRPLVNRGYRYVAAVLPTPQAAGALLADVDDDTRAALVERLGDGLPFALEVTNNSLYAAGIDVFRVPDRYGENQAAPHIVGYLSDGVGAAGIERAYDRVLQDAGGEIGVVYQMDATGRMMQDSAVSVERQNEEPVGGVVLTLDRDLQEITQAALAGGADKGAAVVLDTATGDILAMTSLPAFDPNDIAASLESEDAPFINRAVSGYNIGSVFKLIVSAAALESGISRYHEHECLGYIDVNGQVFRCNNNAVHGTTDMARALEVSCNTYFISLARELDPALLLSVSQSLGLGRSVELAEGITTQAGNLPALDELQNPAHYANFSFGQGSSLASPLQMAQAVAAIANGGTAVTPRLVRGTTADGSSLDTAVSVYAGITVLSERSSATLQSMMVGVVEEGSGKPALPLVGSAGGKTSSAQTGVMDEDGDEIVHAWFAGFYPAASPRYSIVVFVEGGESGEQAAAPIFKAIADGIARLA